MPFVNGHSSVPNSRPAVKVKGIGSGCVIKTRSGDLILNRPGRHDPGGEKTQQIPRLTQCRHIYMTGGAAINVAALHRAKPLLNLCHSTYKVPPSSQAHELPDGTIRQRAMKQDRKNDSAVPTAPNWPTAFHRIP